jgi:hypothetical protein|tara:strand:+ start:15438 stop:15821 length:384 start_codon:yes stop_codon:yes gene_type:complete
MTDKKDLVKELGKISDAWFGFNDRGMLDCWVMIDYEEGCSQGFGGICLDTYNKETEEREGSAFGCDYLVQLMTIFKVDRIEKLRGKYCYALKDDGINGLIRGLQSMRDEGSKTFLVSELCKKHGVGK